MIVLGAIVALVVAVRLRPDVLFDDAAITFRYAARIADGSGFTFNDGDRTNGASAPLYTLVLALGAVFGAAPERTAVVLGAMSFTTVVVLVGVLADRIAGRVASVVAMGVLTTSTVFQNQALSGMESALACALGLGALVALAGRRFALAGLLLGLALFNRLDALALAVPMVSVAAILDRRAARRVAMMAAGTLLPWIVFATVYFGSPIPYSGTQKLDGRAGASPFDPTWVLRAVTGREGIVVFLVAMGLPALVVAKCLGTRFHGLTELRVWSGRIMPPAPVWTDAAVMVAFAWIAVHGVFYSLVDLGAPYPWYTTVIFPVVALGSGVTVALLIRSVRHAYVPVGHAHPRTRMPVLAAAVLVFGLVSVAAVSRSEAITFTAQSVTGGFEHRASRDLDGTRRAAGGYLRVEADKGDVVRTCFGWVAYGAIDHAIDEACPLSTRRPVGNPDWIVESPGPGESLDVPKDFRLVAKFEAEQRQQDQNGEFSGATFVFRLNPD
ncbi:MAG: hypothetical protein WBA45_00610 [Microthrixaceae bacterium]